MNMLIANRTDYFNYSPGYIPDNLVSESYPASTPYAFSLTFNAASSHTWVLYNQLSEIIPVPQHAWDKTSATSPVGTTTPRTSDTAEHNALRRAGELRLRAHGRCSMLTNGLNYVYVGDWWLIYPTGICIVLTVVAFNFIGDALRDALEVRLQSR
jgi:hypothetical protein